MKTSESEVKVVPAKTSILESEIFRPDPEQEREMYLRMFVDNYQPEDQKYNQTLAPLSDI